MDFFVYFPYIFLYIPTTTNTTNTTTAAATAATAATTTTAATAATATTAGYDITILLHHTRTSAHPSQHIHSQSPQWNYNIVNTFIYHNTYLLPLGLALHRSKIYRPCTYLLSLRKKQRNKIKTETHSPHSTLQLRVIIKTFKRRRKWSVQDAGSLAFLSYL